eukprot:TRINITY_DN2568_c1_g1_i1.p1 TRINITY_DN2568_c1_g1~~TRINITY_DN2568_c1_g1_i1.p1  ORF type:complete len:1339 (-),score=244.12 TRINITY_DN2568_c1_g1_i1:157-4173(-)
MEIGFGRVYDGSNQELTTVPEVMWRFQSIAILNLSHNHISSLPDAISSFTILHHLRISHNQMSDLPRQISFLSRLTKIDLSCNEITTFPSTLVDMPQLLDLSLSRNKMSELPDEISRLQHLTLLDISHNQISELPNTLGTIETLHEFDVASNPMNRDHLVIWSHYNFRENLLSLNGLDIDFPWEFPHSLQQVFALDVSSNSLSELPIAISMLSNLQSLKAHRNKIKAIPSGISCLLQLRLLRLEDNEIAFLPEELMALTNLESLKLQNNQISFLPPSISCLKSLQTFSIGDNQVDCIPPEFCHLSELQHFIAWRNKITALPDDLESLSSAIYLDLFENQITSIPARLRRLTSLERLYLGKNHISHIPDEIGLLSNLTRLDISFNFVSSLPYTLKNMVKLSKLSLEGNFLPELDILLWSKYRGSDHSVNAHNCFVDSLSLTLLTLPRIKKLDLSKNKFCHLPDVICLLYDLESLDIRENQITSLPPTMVDMTKLVSLKVDHDKILYPPKEALSIGVANYLGFLERSSSERALLPSGRIICLGDESSGCSTIMDYLLKRKPRHTQPRATDVDIVARVDQDLFQLLVDQRSVSLSVWILEDDIMRLPLYPYLFSPGALFILFFDSNDVDYHTKMYNWISMIATAAPKARIMVVYVFTSRITDAGEYEEDTFSSKLRKIAAFYKDLVTVDSIVVVRADRIDDLNHLRDAICSAAAHLPFIQKPPSTIFSICRVIVDNLLRGREYPVLSWNEYCILQKHCYSPESHSLMNHFIETGLVIWKPAHASDRLPLIQSDYFVRILSHAFHYGPQAFSYGIEPATGFLEKLRNTDDKTPKVWRSTLIRYGLCLPDPTGRYLILPSRLPPGLPPSATWLPGCLNHCVGFTTCFVDFNSFSRGHFAYILAQLACRLGSASGLDLQPVYYSGTHVVFHATDEPASTMNMQKKLLVSVCVERYLRENGMVIFVRTYSQKWLSSQILKSVLAVVESVGNLYPGTTMECAVVCPKCQATSMMLDGCGVHPLPGLAKWDSDTIPVAHVQCNKGHGAISPHEWLEGFHPQQLNQTQELELGVLSKPIHIPVLFHFRDSNKDQTCRLALVCDNPERRHLVDAKPYNLPDEHFCRRFGNWICRWVKMGAGNIDRKAHGQESAQTDDFVVVDCNPQSDSDRLLLSYYFSNSAEADPHLQFEEWFSSFDPTRSWSHHLFALEIAPGHTRWVCGVCQDSLTKSFHNSSWLRSNNKSQEWGSVLWRQNSKGSWSKAFLVFSAKAARLRIFRNVSLDQIIYEALLNQHDEVLNLETNETLYEFSLYSKKIALNFKLTEYHSWLAWTRFFDMWIDSRLSIESSK